MDTHPDGVINIVDAINMERNLYLVRAATTIKP